MSSYLFPLLTFPYVTRVLGVDNIGICNFVNSIIQYFIYFSMMGIMTVGIREIARVKDNPDQLSKTFSALLNLNLLFTIISIIALLVGVTFIQQLSQHREMLYIGGAKILANTLLVEWLFKGLEDFKYITIRSLAIKIIYVISVFVFVKSPEDYIIYFGLTCFSVIINAVVNLLYAKKTVKYSAFCIDISNYLKPVVVLGAYSFLTSMYTTFNVAFLGFSTNPTQVGYYTTATKLYSLIMSFFTAFTGVMMPRMSSLLSEGKTEEFKDLTTKSIEILLSISFPIIIFSTVCASDIVLLIAGPGYEGAVLPMQIVMPLMLIIGLEQVLVLQILTPLKCDRVILLNSFIGSILAIILNIILVPKLQAIGTAIVWILCEFVVLFLAQFSVNKQIKFNIPYKAILFRILFALPIISLCLLVHLKLRGVVGIIVCAGLVMFFWIMAEVYLFKNDSLLQAIKNRNKKKGI